MLPSRPADAGCFCLIFLSLCLCQSGLADVLVSAEIDPRVTGLKIFEELDRRDSGYIDMLVGLEMVLISKSGKRNRRVLQLKQLEQAEQGDMALIRFDSPSDIRGTALLSKSNGDKPEDQWLYLPAFKRVKKIASKNRSGPFAGSEFSFEDLSVQEVDDFDYHFLDSGLLGTELCFIVERFPRDKYSAYSRQRVWVDQSEYRIRKIEYFDESDRLIKTLHNRDFVLYNSRLWKPQMMVMQNHRNKRITELHWSKYRFATGLNEHRDFSTNSLKRFR